VLKLLIRNTLVVISVKLIVTQLQRDEAV